ncbi:recombinase family protein [Frankia gtarii]|uniref:recombinase family protein n=1 Tax=Frankia gtarii TaxID=2950102 RepID=UPI0021C13BF7|nr:recombinase family protein [Frankia gtarii]
MDLPDLPPAPSANSDPGLFYGRMSHVDLDARVIDQLTRALKDAAASDGDYFIAAAYGDDGLSAWREDVVRPEFEKFLAALRSGSYRIVVVWEESRITRDPRVGAEFGRIMQVIRGKLIVTNGETRSVYDFQRQRDRDAWHNAVGKSVSESGTKSEWVRRAFEVKRERHEFLGRTVGFGWNCMWVRKGKKVVGTWSVNEEEAEWLREASRRVRAGEAIATVADDFYDRGLRIQHRTSTRKDFEGETGVLTRRTLANYLRNPRIAGLDADGNQDRGWTVTGELSNFPGILTEEEWRATVAALAGGSATIGAARTKKKKDSGPERRATGKRVINTFAGYFVCFACNRSLVRTDTSDRALWRHQMGKSRTHVDCPQSFSIPAGDADKLATIMVAEYIRARAWAKPADTEVGRLQARRARINESLEELPDKIADEIMSADLAGRTEKRYKAQLVKIEQDLAKLARFSTVIDGKAALQDLLGDDVMKRRRVLSVTLEKISVIPGRDLPLRDRLTVVWREQSDR